MSLGNQASALASTSAVLLRVLSEGPEAVQAYAASLSKAQASHNEAAKAAISVKAELAVARKALEGLQAALEETGRLQTVKESELNQGLERLALAKDSFAKEQGAFGEEMERLRGKLEEDLVQLAKNQRKLAEDRGTLNAGIINLQQQRGQLEEKASSFEAAKSEHFAWHDRNKAAIERAKTLVEAR